MPKMKKKLISFWDSLLRPIGWQSHRVATVIRTRSDSSGADEPTPIRRTPRKRKNLMLHAQILTLHLMSSLDSGPLRLSHRQRTETDACVSPRAIELVDFVTHRLM